MADVNLISANSSQGRQIINTAYHRPWMNEKDGRIYITTYKGSGDKTNPKNYRHVPVDNASMQTYSTLRRDEWKLLDEAVVATRKDRLQGIQDIIDAGLVKSITNPMAYTEFEWHQKQVDISATIAMSPRDRGQNDRPTYTYQYTPNPIIMADFEIDVRELETSRNMGTDIETDMVKDATRAVNEKLENLLFADDSYQLENNKKIESFINTSYASTGSLTSKWDDSSTSAENIKDDVFNMIADAEANKYYGPYRLYIPKSYRRAIQDDYDTSGKSTQTIQQRLEAIEGISKIVAVDKLPADTVVLVEMDEEVVRLLDGMGPTVVQWQANGPYVTDYKVVRMAVPQIRWTKDDVTGVVRYTG